MGYIAVITHLLTFDSSVTSWDIQEEGNFLKNPTHSGCSQGFPLLGRSSRLVSVVSNHGNRKPQRIGLWAFQMACVNGLYINGSDPNHLLQGSLYYQSNNAPLYINKIPQTYHTFASSLIPVKWVPFNDPKAFSFPVLIGMILLLYNFWNLFSLQNPSPSARSWRWLSGDRH